VTHDRGGPFRPVGRILKKYCLIKTRLEARKARPKVMEMLNDASVDDTSSVIAVNRIHVDLSLQERPNDSSPTIAVTPSTCRRVTTWPVHLLAPERPTPSEGVRGRTSDMDGRYHYGRVSTKKLSFSPNASVSLGGGTWRAF
jgi:hypothetical protein